MSRPFLTVIVVVAVCSLSMPTKTSTAPPLDDQDDAWARFKADFNKEYPSEAEHDKRRLIFLDNFAFIRQHNDRADQGLESTRLAVNQFADLTPSEFKAQRAGVRPGPSSVPAKGRLCQKDDEIPCECFTNDHDCIDDGSCNQERETRPVSQASCCCHSAEAATATE